jgi:hypothetical protein
MQSNKNHIGTVVKFCNDIADDMNARYSHGNITEMNFRSMLVYPYVHANIGSVSIGDSVTLIQVNLMICDRVNVITTENQGLNQSDLYSQVGYTENNNYAMVLQQLYGDFAIALKKYEMQYYNVLSVTRPVSLTPFEESYDDVVAGYTITLQLTLMNPIVTDGYC